jgi:isopenicillin-N N-acyltransferase-like protein
MNREKRQFPLLEVAGAPYAMGVQHGQAFRAEIARSLAIVGGLLPVPLETAQAYARQSIPYCQAQAPELMEEVQGIADGAGLTFEEIFTLNASLDLLGSPLSAQAYVTPDCWAAACAGSATAGGHPLVLWTAEDSARWFDTALLIRATPLDAPPYLLWTFAGFVGRPGMTARLALAAACQPATDCGPGLPYPFICRKALACDSTASAAVAIMQYERMSGMAYTLGDSAGQLATLITTARTAQFVADEPGWTVCAGRWAEERKNRFAELLRERWGQNGWQELARIQRDHGPGALCAHDDSGLVTLTTFICELATQTMWIAYGSPCEQEYSGYTI